MKIFDAAQKVCAVWFLLCTQKQKTKFFEIGIRVTEQWVDGS